MGKKSTKTHKHHESAKEFFQKLGHGLKTFATDAWNDIKRPIDTVYDDVKSGLSSIANKTFDTTNHLISGSERVLEKGEDTIGSSVNSISTALPYAIGAGALALIGYGYYTSSNKKKQTE